MKTNESLLAEIRENVRSEIATRDLFVVIAVFHYPITRFITELYNN